MKKLFSTLLAVLGFSILMAQSTEVPSGVKTAFKNKYKSTSVEWAGNSQNYTAKWESDGKKMTAVYSHDDPATLIRTEMDAQLSELSTGTQSSIKERFQTEGSPYTFIRAYKVEGFGNIAEGCEFSIKNGDRTSTLNVFFDAAGTMVKREMY